MSEILTVTQLVLTINSVLETLKGTEVEGEVIDFKIIHDRWVTFSIKDEKSSVGCFMPVWDLKTEIEDGMLVRVKGKLNLRDKGFFSFVLSDVRPAGEGSLKRAFELLQKKLTNEGLFAPERKRRLPRFPRHICLITSEDAAAYSDFLKVLKARQGGLQISFLHTQVQGEPAPKQIIHRLEYANTHLENLDAIILIRGGGSLEDLHAFNDESVVRSIAASRTPIIVGIGHERDVSLSELAADLRASTPSNAAELLVETRDKLIAEIEYMQTKLSDTFKHEIRNKLQLVDNKTQILHNITATLSEKIDNLRNRLAKILPETITEYKDKLNQVERLLSSLSPINVLKKGYSITRDSKGEIIKNPTLVNKGEEIITRVLEGQIKSNVV